MAIYLLDTASLTLLQRSHPRQLKLNVGRMDLKIASIGLELGDRRLEQPS